nr:universal stress protein [Streptomyces sp. NBC_00886]
MGKPSAERIIVGVDASPAGLGALRAAVAQARLADRELLAVRAYEPPPSLHPAWPGQADWGHAQVPGPVASQLWLRLQVACEQQELRAVENAFARAMGGVPHGVRVRPVASMGSPGAVLVAAAYLEDDLLVVGEPDARHRRRLWPWRWFRRSTCRFCFTHAVCAVLAVPPHGLGPAADDSTRQRSRPTLQEGSDTMPHARVEKIPSTDTDTDSVTVWPTRACCCSAPPVVRVLLPTRDGRTVDLFLCGHHYRASLGPLALADATASFRESRSALSLAGHR